MGNTHQTIKEPKKTNKWKMYITINGKADLTAKYIKAVTYTLHETYRVPVHRLTEAPFSL